MFVSDLTVNTRKFKSNVQRIFKHGSKQDSGAEPGPQARCNTYPRWFMAATIKQDQIDHPAVYRSVLDKHKKIGVYRSM
jgi:hypothetical protein